MTVAFEFARKAHMGQKYGKHAYIKHLQDVNTNVYLLFRSDPDVDLLADLAWLHDCIEDIPHITAQTLYDTGSFSNTLIEAVVAITKRDGESRFEYLTRCMQNRFAKRVKIADTLANLTCSIADGKIFNVLKYSKQLYTLYGGDTSITTIPVKEN